MQPSAEADLFVGLAPRPPTARFASPGTWKRLRREVLDRTTLTDLAPLVGLSPSALCRKLSGKTRLRRTEAEAIVEALRVLGGAR